MVRTTFSSYVVPSLLLTLATACGTGKDSSSNRSGTTQTSAKPATAKVATGNATLKGTAFGLDAGIVPSNAATVRIEVLSQAGCENFGGWSQGQRNWHHRDGWHHQGIWGLRNLWTAMSSSFSYGYWSYSSSYGYSHFSSGGHGYGGGGGGYGYGLVDTSTLDASGGFQTAPANPYGNGAYGCVVQNVVNQWGSQSSAHIGNLPDGAYDIVVEVDDQGGSPLMGGSTTVSVANGQVATADIGLGPIPVGNQPGIAVGEPNGTGGVDVNFGAPGSTGTTGTATPIPPTGATSGNILVFANTPLTGAVGGCSAVSLEVLDTNGNLVNEAGATTLSLATSASTGAFYTDSGCTTAATTAQIAAGGNGVTVYYRDTAGGAPTLTVTDPSGAAGAASAAITLN